MEQVQNNSDIAGQRSGQIEQLQQRFRNMVQEMEQAQKALQELALP
jgi:HAMP domain-containing protein